MTREAKRQGRPPCPAEGAAEAVKLIKIFKKRANLTDVALADAICFNQSTVSRTLGKTPPTWTECMHKLYDYAVNQPHLTNVGQTIDPTNNAEDTLRKAALDAWDGTPDGLDRLVKVLTTLRDYRRPRKRPSNKHHAAASSKE